MKPKKKLAFFIALISMFYCVSLIESTYAKYISSVEGNANLTIARWNILVNDQDIVNNSNFSNYIVPTFDGTDYIKSGVIAPTGEGYFDITINSENTDVSFDFNITATPDDSNTVSDLVISRYEVNDVSTSYTGSINGEMLHTNTNKTITYRFYVYWNDEAGSVMTNSDDVTASKEGTAAIKVSINFTQKREV